MGRADETCRGAATHADHPLIRVSASAARHATPAGRLQIDRSKSLPPRSTPLPAWSAAYGPPGTTFFRPGVTLLRWAPCCTMPRETSVSFFMVCWLDGTAQSISFSVAQGRHHGTRTRLVTTHQALFLSGTVGGGAGRLLPSGFRFPRRPVQKLKFQFGSPEGCL